MGRPSKCPPKEVMHYLYVQKRYSMEQIAKIFGVSREAVRLWLSKYNIPSRSRIYAVKTRGKKKRLSRKEILEELKSIFNFDWETYLQKISSKKKSKSKRRGQKRTIKSSQTNISFQTR